MSRSRKKNPSYEQYCWDSVLKKTQKKAERRAVKMALATEDWENIPKRKEVSAGPYYTNRYIADRDFERMAARVRNTVNLKDSQNLYLFCRREGAPYDYEAEWTGEWLKKVKGQDSVIDKEMVDGIVDNNIKIPYHEVMSYVRDWFPMSRGSNPVDLRNQDPEFIKKMARRK